MEPIHNRADGEMPTYLDDAMANLSDEELTELIECAVAEMERRGLRPC